MDGSFRWTSLLYLLGVLIIVAPAAWHLRHDRRWPFYLALWLGIAVVLALGYRLVHG